MLKDELQTLTKIIETKVLPGSGKPGISIMPDGCVAVSIRNACREICDAWKAAVFSDACEHSLKRYFHFHLEGIRKLSDTLLSLNIQERCNSSANGLAEIDRELHALIVYQYENCKSYFNLEIQAPASFRNRLLSNLEYPLQELSNILDNVNIDAILRTCLRSYFSEMTTSGDHSSFSYRSLFYFEDIVKKVKSLSLADKKRCSNQLLADCLFRLNFNHFRLFNYYRQRMTSVTDDLPAGEKIGKLKDELLLYKWMPQNDWAYDPSWPSISAMFCNWLEEQVTQAENSLKQEINAISSPLREKLSFNLSVAQLACMTRLFFEENLYNSQAVSAIFKFMAGHFETKRQNHISPGSLSKEYYSTNQVTAAVVKDMLLKMVARINHNFFPVLAVIGAVSSFYLKNH